MTLELGWGRSTENPVGKYSQRRALNKMYAIGQHGAALQRRKGDGRFVSTDVGTKDEARTETECVFSGILYGAGRRRREEGREGKERRGEERKERERE